MGEGEAAAGALCAIAFPVSRTASAKAMSLMGSLRGSV
jgi:hypothetical protein